MKCFYFMILITLLCVLLERKGFSFELELPPQKIAIGTATVNASKQTISKSEAYSLPVGLAGEYSLFLVNSLSLFGQFEMNLDMGSQSVVFMGGGGGITYYPIGGSKTEHEDAYIRAIEHPSFNAYFGGGVASRKFDFIALEKKQEQEGVVVRDKKDPPTGNVMAIMVMVGAEYPFENVIPGMRIQYLKSLSGATQPDLTFMEIWLSCAFML